MKEKPLVSIIVPTYNSSKTLNLCLESIKRQTYSDIEIIVVDNYSIDDTVEIAEKHGSKVFRVEALRSLARNYGVMKSKGVFLLFLDADQELTPKVIEDCVKKVIDYHVYAIMIPEVRIGEGFWAKCRALERLTYIGDPLVENARFYRRDIFEKLGGYDEILEAGEDKELHARFEDTGYAVSSVKGFMRHLEGRVRLGHLARRSFFYGKTYIRYARKQPKRARIQFLPIRLNFIRNWKTLANQPLYACGMFFLKFVEYTAGIIGLISSNFDHVARRNDSRHTI